MKKIIIAVAAGTVCLSLLGFWVASAWQDRSCELAADLHSYQSQGKALRVLGVNSDNWQTIEKTDLLVTDTRPRFSNQTVLVRGVSHLGVQGDLYLYFFNDRLMKTQFYATDMEKYRAALASKESIIFNDDLETRAAPATKIWIGKDRDGRMYVGWVDLRLWQEHVDWIKKYS